MLDFTQNDERSSSKGVLKAACNSGVPLEKYNKLNDLALQYLNQDDISKYPKAVAIYQYLLKLIKQHPDLKNPTINAEEIDRNITNVETKFVRRIMLQKQISDNYGNRSLEGTRRQYDRLKAFREIIKTKLGSVENLGVKEGQEELDEDGLKQRAEEVEKIYGEVSNFFIGEQGLMNQLLDECIKELGGVPNIITKGNVIRSCEYAVFGMGSMSLGTMTPWSDIEFGILIEDGLTATDERRSKEFFRNVTALLNIKVINFGESVLHYQGIKELNDFSTEEKDDWFRDELSPKGFCFDALLPDGCKTPMGKKECYGYKDYDLIATPSQMSYLLTSGGYVNIDSYLGNALRNVIMINGQENLLKKYKTAIFMILNGSEKLGEKRSMELLEKDLKKLDPEFEGLNYGGELVKMKSEFYRLPTILLEHLSNIFCLNHNSAWGKVREFSRDEKLSQANVDSIKVLLALTTELRLRVYAHYGHRKDELDIYSESGELEDSRNIYHIDSTAIITSIYNRLRPFYVEMSGFVKEYNENETEQIHRDSYFDRAEFYVNNDKINGDRCLRQFHYADAIINYRRALNYRGRNNGYYLHVCICLWHAASSLDKVEELKNVFQDISAICSKISNDKPSLKSSVDVIILDYGGQLKKRCLDYDGAKNNFLIALELQKNIDGENTSSLASLYGHLAALESERGNHDLAIEYDTNAFNIIKILYQQRDYQYISTLVSLGNDYVMFKKYDMALPYLNEAQGLVEQHYSSKSPLRLSVYTNLATVHRYLENTENEISSLKTVYELELKLDGFSHLRTSSASSRLSEAYSRYGRYDKALEYSKKALQSTIIRDGENDSNTAVAYIKLSKIYREMGEYEEALNYAELAPKVIQECFHIDHVYVAESLANIGEILSKMVKYEEAIEYFKKAVSKYEKTEYGRNTSNIKEAKNNIVINKLLLANQNLLQGIRRKAKELYIELEIDYHHLELEIYNYAEKLWNIGELDASLSCYEALCKKLSVSSREANHGLARAYHVKALEEEKRNHTTERDTLLRKADASYRHSVNMILTERTWAITYVEYAMFLLKYHDKSNSAEYKRIKELLQKAMLLGDDGSEAEYIELERAAIVTPLQELLKRQKMIVVEKPYLLACHLLISALLIHSEYNDAQKIFKEFNRRIQSFLDNDVLVYLYDYSKRELDAAMVKNQQAGTPETFRLMSYVRLEGSGVATASRSSSHHILVKDESNNNIQSSAVFSKKSNSNIISSIANGSFEGSSIMGQDKR